MVHVLCGLLLIGYSIAEPLGCINVLNKAMEFRLYGGCFTILYIVIVCGFAWINIKEYRFLNEEFGGKQGPAQKVLYIGIIYTSSFVIRSVYNIIALSDPSALLALQTSGCADGNSGWAILQFCLHFFGEVLPLCLLFYLQISVTKLTRTSSLN